MGNASMNNTYHPSAFLSPQPRLIRGGVLFDLGVGEDVAKDFLGQLGDGAVKAGKQLGNGQYVFTGGEGTGKDWKQYSPGDDYERIVSVPGITGTRTGRNDGILNHQFDRDPVQVWRRKDRPPEAAKPVEPAAPVDTTPKPPAPQVDASNPSLADALRDQSQQRPALQDALNSALRLNGQDAQERPAARATASSSTDQQQGEDRSDRRYAASDRWRQRLEEVSGRFA